MTVANVQVLHNKKGSSASIYFSANGFFLASGNNITSNVNATTENLAIGDEVLRGVNISKAIWGTSNTQQFWTIQRGANNVIVLNNSGQIDFDSAGMAFSFDKAANVVVTLTGTGSGFLILNVGKESVYTSQY